MGHKRCTNNAHNVTPSHASQRACQVKLMSYVHAQTHTPNTLMRSFAYKATYPDCRTNTYVCHPQESSGICALPSTCATCPAHASKHPPQITHIHTHACLYMLLNFACSLHNVLRTALAAPPFFSFFPLFSYPALLGTLLILPAVCAFPAFPAPPHFSPHSTGTTHW